MAAADGEHAARIAAQLARVRARLDAGTAACRELTAQVARAERRMAEARAGLERGEGGQGLPLRELGGQLGALAAAITEQEHANRHAQEVVAALEHLLNVAREAGG